VACATHELTTDLTTPVPITQLSASRTPPDPVLHHTLQPGQTLELYARQVVHLDCLQCGWTYRIVDAPPAALSCPNDGYDLAGLRSAVLADPDAFTAPVSGQNPEFSPASLTSRGYHSIDTAHRPVTSYWDESRFLQPSGADYLLWALTPGGPLSVSILGRATWGAAPVRIQPPGRRWEFHKAESTSSPPYAGLPVPLSENRPLADVYSWITIHHTASSIVYTADGVRELQAEQITKSKADLAYEFVIDGNGLVYEGRPLGIEGEHAELFNAGNLGIVLTGDFESRWQNGYVGFDRPTTAQLQSLNRLVDVLAHRFGIRSVWTHKARKRQAASAVPTECPGAFLEPQVAALRRLYPGPPP
jgi:hypothetical protein